MRLERYNLGCTGSCTGRFCRFEKCGVFAKSHMAGLAKVQFHGTAVRTAQVQVGLYQKKLSDFKESSLLCSNWYSFLVKNYKYTHCVLIRIWSFLLYNLYRCYKLE